MVSCGTAENIKALKEKGNNILQIAYKASKKKKKPKKK